MQDKSIRVVIVEDHSLMREGLRWILGRNKSIRIVGEAGNCRAAAETIERLKPDLVLLDLILPEGNAMDLLRTTALRTKVLAVSMRNDLAFVAEALRQGAAGYVVKESSPTELLQAIETVVAGRSYLSRQLDADAVQRALGRSGAATLPITKRERTILVLSAEGATTAQIAQRLSISRRTVEMHRSSFMHKLALRSQTDLVRFAIRNDLVRP